ncbi:beta-aspartyl-peptidase [Clostridium hydrogenum]|uniref:beta-aspartyl-peptidase n=1 Tax=Clostridium hydrogenum TaxID=2855764 RepID=UPI001F3B9187|nr:beta-aspartyl-peptidase [Clostridium hydrogenum]
MACFRIQLDKEVFAMFILIKNVRVYSPKDLGCKDILICNDKIVDLDKDININVKNIKIVDGTGKIVFPGYIDQHVHVVGGGGEGGFTTRVPEINVSSCIKGGVTTLVGLLGTDAITRSVENLVAKTKALNEEGITAYCLTGSYEYPSITLTGSVQKDIAYINEVIGVKLAISDHRCSNITKEELIRLVSEVRLAGLISGKPGVVHFHLGSGKNKLKLLFELLEESDLPIKHLRPTHISRHYEEDAVKFAALGGYIDFTANRSSEDFLNFVVEMGEKVPKDRMTMSSDSNGSMPKWNDKKEMIGIEAAKITNLHETIKRFIKERNIQPEDILPLVTSNVAKALELYPKKGIIAVDSDADLLILDKELNIDSVIAKGKVMMLNEEVLVKGTYE